MKSTTKKGAVRSTPPDLDGVPDDTAGLGSWDTSGDLGSSSGGCAAGDALAARFRRGADRREAIAARRAAMVAALGEPYIVTRRDEEKRPTGFKLREQFIAARVIYEAGLVRDAQAGFFRYNEEVGLWEVVSPEQIFGLCGAAIYDEARLGKLPALTMSATSRSQAACAAQVRAMAERRGFFDDAPELIVARDCALRVTAEGVERLPHSPDHRARAAVAIHYDERATCSRTEGELVRLNLSADDATAFWKYFGLCLLGRNVIQRMLIIHGAEGGTGKTCLVNLIAALVGKYFVADLRPSQLDTRFELGRYAGKKMLTGPDVPGGFLNTAGAQRVKALVGGEGMTPEDKNRSCFVAEPIRGDFPIAISSNEELYLLPDASTSPWRRRILLLETLSNRPPKKIDRFEEVLLRAEGPGIFARAVRGLQELLVDMRDEGGIRMSDEQARRIDVLLGQSNSVKDFLSSSGRVVRGPGQGVTVEEAEHAYFEFCRESGFQPVPKARVKLKDAVEGVFGLPLSNSLMRDGKARTGWRGIALVPPG